MKKIVRNFIIVCLLFIVGVLCVTYASTQENIEWYWLGLCIAGGIIGIISSILLTVVTLINFEERFWL